MSGLSIDQLSVAYGGHRALASVHGRFEPGSMTAVVGPNGAGKSTLLKALAGLLRPTRGRVVRDDSGRSAIAYLPQTATVDRSFPISVGDTVSMGAWRETGAFRAIRPERLGRAEAALSAVGLDGFARRSIGALSAGQFQRVLFARLLMQDAPVILLDEPFAAVDTRTVRDLTEILGRWHGERRTIIAVLHDLDQVRALFPETLLLACEQIAWGPTAETLTAPNLTRARVVAETWDAVAARDVAA